jgi:hypothetical protein
VLCRPSTVFVGTDQSKVRRDSFEHSKTKVGADAGVQLLNNGVTDIVRRQLEKSRSESARYANPIILSTHDNTVVHHVACDLINLILGAKVGFQSLSNLLQTTGIESSELCPFGQNRDVTVVESMFVRI